MTFVCVCVYTYNNILRANLLGKLDHMVMETESHERPSASWRPSGAGSVTQSKSEDLRTKETDGAILSPRPKA